jgi:hypothetical protein
MTGLATAVFGSIFVVLVISLVSFGFWLYVRAVGEFPGSASCDKKLG